MKYYDKLPLSEDAKYARQKIKDFRAEFDTVFGNELKKQKKEAKRHYSTHAITALNIYNQIALRGGKRLRASLVYFAYKMLGGKNITIALDAARAIEMIHAYLLVVDDFTDKSNTRRGGKTAHLLTEDYIKRENFIRADPYHHGVALSITAAMLQAHAANKILLNLDVDEKMKNKAALNLNERIVTTAFGQLTDVFNALLESVEEKDVTDMIRYKTGVYTFENPLHTGAILAGASNFDLDLLSKYAIPAGIAFQLHDDILGMFGDVDKTGKSNMDDLMEGKMTLLIQHALNNGSPEQVNIINKYLGNRNIGPKEHALVQKVLVDCGSLNYSVTKSREFVKKAKGFLKDVPSSWKKDEVRYLLGIADYVIQRSH